MTDEQPQKCSLPKDELLKCPNMKSRENDRDMSGDNYDCKVCGKSVWLDYDEMR